MTNRTYQDVYMLKSFSIKSIALIPLALISLTTLANEMSEKSYHDFDPYSLTPSEAAMEITSSANLDKTLQSLDLSKYDYVDPKKLIPENLKLEALQYYEANFDKIPNKDTLIVVDFKAHSSKKRQYVIDMRSGDVNPMLVTHGKNSDRNNDGYATDFSNTVDSKQSSLGFYLTAESYTGKFGYSLRLDGLSATTSKVRERAIVIHPADYVVDNGKKIGRSWGCLAVDPKLSKSYIDKVKDGVLILAGLGK